MRRQGYRGKVVRLFSCPCRPVVCAPEVAFQAPQLPNLPRTLPFPFAHAQIPSCSFYHTKLTLSLPPWFYNHNPSVQIQLICAGEWEMGRQKRDREAEKPSLSFERRRLGTVRFADKPSQRGKCFSFHFLGCHVITNFVDILKLKLCHPTKDI